jgi:ribosome-associated protein
MSDNGIVVSPTLTIPASELTFRATRAGGPGGQHVNTSSTRIELLWDVTHSTVITEEERSRLLEKLAARLDSEGMVRVVASDRRSQAQNRESASERLARIVRQGLVVPRKRRKTRPTAASREQRLSEKKRHSERKRDRRRGFED